MPRAASTLGALRDHASSLRYSARPVTAALLGTTGADTPARTGYDSVVAAAAAAVPA